MLVGTSLNLTRSSCWSNWNRLGGCSSRNREAMLRRVGQQSYIYTLCSWKEVPRGWRIITVCVEVSREMTLGLCLTGYFRYNDTHCNTLDLWKCVCACVSLCLCVCDNQSWVLQVQRVNIQTRILFPPTR